MKRIYMTLAMSLDGYIADENGAYDWIKGDGDKTLDTAEKWDYEKFLKGMDVVVMGKRCYEQGMHRVFQNKPVLIATHEALENQSNLTFIKGDVVRETQAYMDVHKLDNAFLFGGGGLLDAFVKADVIDEYIIGIIPVILGRGRKLFLEDNPKIELSLKKITVEEGISILTYVKRS